MAPLETECRTRSGSDGMLRLNLSPRRARQRRGFEDSSDQ